MHCQVADPGNALILSRLTELTAGVHPQNISPPTTPSWRRLLLWPRPRPLWMRSQTGKNVLSTMTTRFTFAKALRHDCPDAVIDDVEFGEIGSVSGVGGCRDNEPNTQTLAPGASAPDHVVSRTASPSSAPPKSPGSGPSTNICGLLFVRLKMARNRATSWTLMFDRPTTAMVVPNPAGGPEIPGGP